MIELLVDMESLVTPGRQWIAGKLVDLDNDSAAALVAEGKAKVPEGVPQMTKQAPKAPKVSKTPKAQEAK